MNGLFLALGFLIGCSLASFLANVVYRLQRGEKFIAGRSHCDHCRRPLNLLDLIPILGYLLRRGHCPACHHPIPLRYPLTEALSGLAGGLVASRLWAMFEQGWFESNSSALLFAVAVTLIFAYLLFVTLYDLDTMLILDAVLFPAIGLALLWVWLQPELGIGGALLAGFTNSLLIGSIVLITRGQGMGLGDVKLAFFLGIITGWPYGLIALLLAFVSGALWGVGLVLLQRKAIKEAIAFGPFLSLGGMIALLFGQPLLDWYLSLPMFY